MLISSLELSSSSRKALGFPACRFLQVLLPVSFSRVFSQEFTGRSSSRCLIFKVHLVDFRQPFGFRLRSLVSQALDYLTTFVSVCQVLFSTFFKIFFRTQLSEPSASQTACLFYQTFQSLSSTFFKFLENFFRPRCPLRLRLRQLADFSRFKSVCQVLFQTFFKLLSPARRSCSFPS